MVTNEKFSRLLKKRKTDLIKEPVKGTVLGPFPSSYKLNEVLKIARRIFPWCQDPRGDRPCFYYHLELCPGACTGEISAQDYSENLQSLILFLRGKKKQVVKDLTKKMQQHSAEQQFEQAQALKQKIELIEEVTTKQYRLTPNLVLPGFGAQQAEKGVTELQKILQTYTNFPRSKKLDRLEGYDVSNIQGKNAAVAMVVFNQGRANKKEYRLFNINTLDTPNDYYMMQEALQRRQNHPEWQQPDLVIIDGGKGQVRAVLKVWQGGNPVIGIAKKPDRLIIPTNQDKDKPEWQVIKLAKDHPALKLVQQVRDESHRFSKQQFQRRHTKQLLK